LHWHYDQGQIVRKLKGEADGPLQALAGFLFKDASPLDLAALKPEFHEPPENMFYKYASGALSPYGDEALGCVRSVAKHGALDPQQYAADSYAEMSAYTGRLNGSSKEFLANYAAGKRWPECGAASDTQANCLVRVPALVARYAGTGKLNDAVADAVRVHQAAQPAADYAIAFSNVLERVVLGAAVADALKWAAFDSSSPLYDENRKEVQDALAELGEDPRAIVSRYGLSCSLPGPWTGPLALAYSAEGEFEEAVRSNIVGGGDNCSRAAVVGALAGAAGGMEGLPKSWAAKVTGWAELEALADKIVADRAYE